MGAFENIDQSPAEAELCGKYSLFNLPQEDGICKGALVKRSVRIGFAGGDAGRGRRRGRDFADILTPNVRGGMLMTIEVGAKREIHDGCANILAAPEHTEDTHTGLTHDFGLESQPAGVRP